MFVLPPLEDVRRIVEEELPKGHSVASVDVVKDDALSFGTAPFTVVIKLSEESDAESADGVGYELARRLRIRWKPEDVHIRVEWSLPGEIA